MRRVDAAHLVANTGLAGGPSYAARNRVRLSPDFVVLDGLTLQADVVVGEVAERRDAPALVADLPDDARQQLLDHLLALGYRLQLGPRRDADRPQVVYARADAANPASALHVEGSIHVEPGVRFGVPALVARDVRVGAGAIIAGSIVSEGPVELEENALVAGELIAQGDLVIHEHAQVRRGVQAGRILFHPEFTTPEITRPEIRPLPPLSQAARTSSSVAVAAATSEPALPDPVAVPRSSSASTTFEGTWPGAPLVGRYRIVAWASIQPSQVAPVLRGHWESAHDFLELEILEVQDRKVSVLAHPGTPRQRRIKVDENELQADEVITTLLPILQRVSTLRILYQDGTVMAAASVESIRWLITVFGKMLRLDSRLHRLKEMRLFSMEELQGQERALP